MVLFSFDVGDEREELSVYSPQLLNDDKWHRVEVEKNIQEAALHIDGEYNEVRPSSPQGHTKLEFYTDLYIGETHSFKNTHSFFNTHATIYDVIVCGCYYFINYTNAYYLVQHVLFFYQVLVYKNIFYKATTPF